MRVSSCLSLGLSRSEEGKHQLLMSSQGNYSSYSTAAERLGSGGKKERRKKNGVSGNKMLTPGGSLAADTRRMWPGFWAAIKSL